MKSQLRIVSDKVDIKKRGITNSMASYEGIIPDLPGDSFRQKKGIGKTKPFNEKGKKFGVKPKRKG